MATDGTTAAAPPPRASQVALAVLAVLTLAVLGFRGYAPTSAPRPTEYHPAGTYAVDLNAADRSELMQVPGLGPQLADAILTHRRDRGPFAGVDDLNHVKGIGGKTVEKIRPFVTVAKGDSPDRPVETLERKPVPAPVSTVVTGLKVQHGDAPIDVNSADAATLQRLPGIGPTLASRIVIYRGTERFKTPEDLRRVKGIGVKTLESLKPFVVCR
jgi:competence protein ComEA